MKVWEVRYAPAPFIGMRGEDALMARCGSPNQARRTVTKLSRRLDLPPVFFDIVATDRIK